MLSNEQTLTLQRLLAIDAVGREVRKTMQAIDAAAWRTATNLELHLLLCECNGLMVEVGKRVEQMVAMELNHHVRQAAPMVAAIDAAMNTAKAAAGGEGGEG